MKILEKVVETRISTMSDTVLIVQSEFESRDGKETRGRAEIELELNIE